jgi:hypothetical protein
MEQIRADCLPGRNGPSTADSACILVVGIHRSGTSSLAGCLEDRGLHLGAVFKKNPFNPKGNRENRLVMELNNSVLLNSGGKWNNPPEKISWTGNLASERDALVACFKQSGARHWGFKDPRTLLTLPFWEEAIPEISFVGTFRHPAAVAKSLNARSGMPLEHGLTLWRKYNRRLLALWARNPFPIVSFDDPRAEYIAAIDSAAAVLGLGEPPICGVFFEESLRHHAGGACGMELGEAEWPIYSELCRIKV